MRIPRLEVPEGAPPFRSGVLQLDDDAPGFYLCASDAAQLQAALQTLNGRNELERDSQSLREWFDRECSQLEGQESADSGPRAVLDWPDEVASCDPAQARLRPDGTLWIPLSTRDGTVSIIIRPQDADYALCCWMLTFWPRHTALWKSDLPILRKKFAALDPRPDAPFRPPSHLLANDTARAASGAAAPLQPVDASRRFTVPSTVGQIEKGCLQIGRDAVGLYFDHAYAGLLHFQLSAQESALGTPVDAAQREALAVLRHWARALDPIAPPASAQDEPETPLDDVLGDWELYYPSAAKLPPDGRMTITVAAWRLSRASTLAGKSGHYDGWMDVRPQDEAYACWKWLHHRWPYHSIHSRDLPAFREEFEREAAVQ